MILFVLLCCNIKMTPNDINKILQIPDWDTCSAIKPEEAKFIYDFIKEKNLSKTLETGFAFARSASHIIAATDKKHIAVDPYQNNYKKMGLENIEQLSMTDKLDFRADFSHNVLPELLKSKQNFDFIFIDGDHKFDGILIDVYYANLLLDQKGYLLLHDTWMRSTRLVESFIKTNLQHFKPIATPLRNFSMFQKVNTDNRDGMFFEEFYTRKSKLSYNLITWLTNGKQTPLKKWILRIKDWYK